MPTINAPTVPQYAANLASMLRYYGLDDMPTFELQPKKLAKVFTISERACRRLLSAAVQQGLLARAETRDEKGRVGYEYRLSDTVTPSDFEPDRYEGEFGGASDAEYWLEDTASAWRSAPDRPAEPEVELQARIDARR